MKIAFFDIDGTLTSEKDGSVPKSASDAIRRARAAGNLMFINTGRCFQNVEERFREVGFDGYDAGAKILTDFFKEQIAQLDTEELDPIGRQIIELCRKDAPLEEYLALTPMDLH